MANKTFKLFADKLGGRQASDYIGTEGEIFYDPTTTTLRISDGVTAGGTALSLGGGAANTGDVTFSTNQIIGSGTASGDGNGYATLELVPDEDLYANHQYLIIDPTAPSHIHIRAGGAQDQSNAEMYLGGERTNVRVADYSGVRLNRTNNNFLNSYSYAAPADYTLGTWFTEGGLHYIEYTTSNTTLANHIYELGNNVENYVTVYWNGGNDAFTLRYGGSSQDMGGGVFRVQVDAAPTGGSPITIENMYWEFYQEQTSFVELTSDFTVNVRDDVRITGRDVFSLRNIGQGEPIEIRTDYDGADHRWGFESDGSLTFPVTPNGIGQKVPYTECETSFYVGGNEGNISTISNHSHTAVLISDVTSPQFHGGTFNLPADARNGTKITFLAENDGGDRSIDIDAITLVGNLATHIGKFTNVPWYPFQSTSAMGPRAVAVAVYYNGFWYIDNNSFD